MLWIFLTYLRYCFWKAEIWTVCVGIKKIEDLNWLRIFCSLWTQVLRPFPCCPPPLPQQNIWQFPAWVIIFLLDLWDHCFCLGLSGGGLIPYIVLGSWKDTHRSGVHLWGPENCSKGLWYMLYIWEAEILSLMLCCPLSTNIRSSPGTARHV